MKRRNADCSKLRRPLKRTKIADNLYGSTFLYVKFLMVWGAVLLADFILEFRFEYLWPFWLLLRSVYDSFKYQGLAFSVFFICIALTSDMICFLFIPVHWLFFAASTYVWVQYVWHTERGICLPTISLWLLFVYIEASVRLKELKNLPFHLDLCRPFAAHCIGYPVVTLGFGFKSYIGYKMRQRKQKEVAKENDFYMHLLQQALPLEQQSVTASPEKNLQSKSIEDAISDGHTTIATGANSSSSGRNKACTTSNHKNCDSSGGHKFSEVDKRHHVLCSSSSSNSQHHHHNHHSSNHTHHHSSSVLEKELEYMENHPSGGGGASSGSGGSPANNNNNNNNTNNNNNQHHQSSSSHHKRTSINDFDENDDLEHDKSFKSNGVIHKMASGSCAGGSVSPPPTSSGASRSRGGDGWGTPPSSTATSALSTVASSNVKDNGALSVQPSSGRRNKNMSSSPKDNTTPNNLNSQRDDHVLRLESDIKRLKADLQASRQCEQDLRGQINTMLTGERSTKNELMQLQQDNDSLQSKLHGLVTARQQDKLTIATLERKLQEERKCRSVVESQLATERKNKKAEEAAARAVALATANARNECTESCKARRRDLESDMKQLRRDFKICEDRLRLTEKEAQALRQYKDSHSEAEVLMSALSAMQDKNAHLENSLSAETRLKLDLFSALGEAKRQLEITQNMVLQREKEIDELKSKIAEVMAVMPPTTCTFTAVSLDSSMISPPLYSSKYIAEEKVTNSTLDPNALVYTPKSGPGGSVVSTVNGDL